jgi:hypothetical protein
MAAKHKIPKRSRSPVGSPISATVFRTGWKRATRPRIFPSMPGMPMPSTRKVRPSQSIWARFSGWFSGAMIWEGCKTGTELGQVRRVWPWE